MSVRKLQPDLCGVPWTWQWLCGWASWGKVTHLKREKDMGVTHRCKLSQDYSTTWSPGRSVEDHSTQLSFRGGCGGHCDWDCVLPQRIAVQCKFSTPLFFVSISGRWHGVWTTPGREQRHGAWAGVHRQPGPQQRYGSDSGRRVSLHCVLVSCSQVSSFRPRCQLQHWTTAKRRKRIFRFHPRRFRFSLLQPR